MHKKLSNNNNNDDNDYDSNDKALYSSYYMPGTIPNIIPINLLNLYVTEIGTVFKPILHQKKLMPNRFSIWPKVQRTPTLRLVEGGLQ